MPYHDFKLIINIILLADLVSAYTLGNRWHGIKKLQDHLRNNLDANVQSVFHGRNSKNQVAKFHSKILKYFLTSILRFRKKA